MNEQELDEEMVHKVMEISGLTIKYEDAYGIAKQIKSLFKKLAHRATPEKKKEIIGQPEQYGYNQAIDETHKRIDKIWED